MQRRHFIAAGAAGIAAAALPLAGQAAQDLIPYTPGLVKQALAEGKTVFLDYYASW